jgi:hypothetical protein
VAWRVEITSVEIADFDADQPVFQVAGHASGRVVACFRAGSGSGFVNSWVAGQFDEVPVRYLGPPRW